MSNVLKVVTSFSVLKQSCFFAWLRGYLCKRCWDVSAWPIDGWCQRLRLSLESGLLKFGFGARIQSFWPLGVYVHCLFDSYHLIPLMSLAHVPHPGLMSSFAPWSLTSIKLNGFRKLARISRCPNRAVATLSDWESGNQKFMGKKCFFCSDKNDRYALGSV